MTTERTTSLHRILSVEQRQAVEQDLAERPPGRETLQKCYDHHRLKERGISFSALARHGRYIRSTDRRQWMQALAEDTTPIEGLAWKNIQLVRERIFEALTEDEISVSDLMKLTVIEKNLTQSLIKQEQWLEKQRQETEARQEAEKKSKQGPPEFTTEAINNIRAIYGLDPIEEEPDKTPQPEPASKSDSISSLNLKSQISNSESSPPRHDSNRSDAAPRPTASRSSAQSPALSAKSKPRHHPSATRTRRTQIRPQPTTRRKTKNRRRPKRNCHLFPRFLTM